jgi:nitrate reductase NapE component
MEQNQPAPQLSYQERKMLEEKEREQARKKLGQRKSFKSFLVVGIIILLIGGAGFFVWSLYEPLGQDYSQAMPFEGQIHVAEGTSVTYNTNPPTSGNHWPIPLQDGIYDKEKPDEAIVHSMEHGRVIVSYKPSLSSQTIERLKNIAGQNAVILVPRSKNDTDIASTAWTRLDKFNLNLDGTFDEKRIKDFIRRYKNKGPENVPGMGGGKSYE